MYFLSTFYAPTLDDAGGILFFGFPCVRTNVHPSVRMYVCTYVRDPVRLRLRHLYQAEFCSFIVRYPRGASMYCGHISSFKKAYVVDTYLNCIDLLMQFK